MLERSRHSFPVLRAAMRLKMIYTTSGPYRLSTYPHRCINAKKKDLKDGFRKRKKGLEAPFIVIFLPLDVSVSGHHDRADVQQHGLQLRLADALTPYTKPMRLKHPTYVRAER